MPSKTQHILPVKNKDFVVEKLTHLKARLRKLYSVRAVYPTLVIDGTGVLVGTDFKITPSQQEGWSCVLLHKTLSDSDCYLFHSTGDLKCLITRTIVHYGAPLWGGPESIRYGLDTIRPIDQEPDSWLHKMANANMLDASKLEDALHILKWREISGVEQRCSTRAGIVFKAFEQCKSREA